MPALATARLDSERVFEQLDRERRRRRMTRKELCAEIGVTGSSYCSWSHGRGISGSALFIPKTACAARRLHETDRSAWWLLIQLIPLIGWIVLVIMLAQPSKVTSSGPAAPAATTPNFRWQS
jgi:hypothetical protein